MRSYWLYIWRETFVLYSISLDPEEDIQDPDLFSELATFLEKDLDHVEREQVFTKTIPRMVERAKALRSTKPPQGLHFSLQQQGIRYFKIGRSSTDCKGRKPLYNHDISFVYFMQVIASSTVTPLSPPWSQTPSSRHTRRELRRPTRRYATSTLRISSDTFTSEWVPNDLNH